MFGYGCIYIIQCKVEDICYIGSTNGPIDRRRESHLEDYRRWYKRRWYVKAPISIYPYMAKHGVRNFTFKLLARYLIADVSHLRAYEQLWMNKYKHTTVNKAPAFKVNRKQYIRQKIQCECGAIIARSSMNPHNQTKKHKMWEEKQ